MTSDERKVKAERKQPSGGKKSGRGNIKEGEGGNIL